MSNDIASKTPTAHKTHGVNSATSRAKTAGASKPEQGSAQAASDASAGGAVAGGQAAAGFMALLASLNQGDGPLAAAAGIALPADVAVDSDAALGLSDGLLRNVAGADPSAPWALAGQAGVPTAVPMAQGDALAASGVQADGGSSRMRRKSHSAGDATASAARGWALAGQGVGANNHATANAGHEASAAANGGLSLAVPGGASQAQTPHNETTSAMDIKLFAALQEARGAQGAKSSEPALAVLAVAEKRGSERLDATKTTNDFTYGGATPTGLSPAGSPAGTVSEFASAAEMQVAEQVQYWISQDVQNAQLKLEGLGEAPVEVSIRMQGNEAHVAFRTDEVQTREVLERSGEHLKDMLAREGVLLSGVSVGTSGANDGGGQDRRPRQGVKQALVQVVDVTAGAPVRPDKTAGRALDLFV